MLYVKRGFKLEISFFDWIFNLYIIYNLYLRSEKVLTLTDFRSEKVYDFTKLMSEKM